MEHTKKDSNYGWCTNTHNPYHKIKALDVSGTFNQTCDWTDDQINKNIEP